MPSGERAPLGMLQTLTAQKPTAYQSITLNTILKLHHPVKS